MKIILGIGNPGQRYQGTRHNIGFMVIDELARRRPTAVFRARFESLVADVTIEDRRALLVKPQVYVNETGRALRAVLDWYGVAPQDMLVVVDDLNLPLGVTRVRRGGSSGGHRGLDSMAQRLGSEAFPRLRVGIGSDKRRRNRDFVLSRFGSDEKAEACAGVERAADAVETWAAQGMERCMNAYNAKPAPPESQDDKEESV